MCFLDTDHFWGETAIVRGLNEVGVRRHDCEAVPSGILPYGGIRREPHQTTVKDVRHFRKQIGKPPDQSRGEAGIEK
jgi:hypothetical protein